MQSSTKRRIAPIGRPCTRFFPVCERHRAYVFVGRIHTRVSWPRDKILKCHVLLPRRLYAGYPLYLVGQKEERRILFHEYYDPADISVCEWPSRLPLISLPTSSLLPSSRNNNSPYFTSGFSLPKRDFANSLATPHIHMCACTCVCV